MDENVYPVVHLNGTSRERLQEQALALMDAVNALTLALHKATPHDRDYYPKGNALLEVMHGQHRRRVEMVGEFGAYAMGLLESLDG